MTSGSVKMLSYVAFIAGIVSVLGSAMIFFRGAAKGGEKNRETGMFVGLWAPTLFAISEMLDRISIEDSEYMGVPIRGHVTEGVREMLGAR